MRKLLLPALAALLTGACDDRPTAYGDYNGVVAAMDPALWGQIGTEISDALEPTILTVREERTFSVTYQDPTQPEWSNLKRFRQVLLVGTGDEPWMEDALEKVDGSVNGPGHHTARDVWARGQQVTLILVSADNPSENLRPYLAEVNRVLDAQFRGWARQRMYMTGVDSALADTLLAVGRFQLFVPQVYEWARRDSVFQFRNDNPDPAELIRQVTVTWKTPIPPDMQPEGILAWRAEVAAAYSEPQDVDLSVVDAGPFLFQGRAAYRIQAVWKSPPELNWPAAGPFITRAVICPEQDRMYLLDAWLYAPAVDKYEYMIQLETILDSFRCGPT
jgi:hypothetical protein